MIIFYTILFLPSDIEMWGKQVNLYITWIIWSRVIACYEDDVCVLFQCYQQNNKITLIAALIEILQGLGCIFYFLTFSVFPLIKRTNFSQMIQLASHLLNPNLLNMQTLWEFFVLIFQFKERCRIYYDLMLSYYDLININMKSWYIYYDFRIKYMIDPEYWLLLMLLHQVLLLVIVYDDHAWSFYS